MNRNEYRRALIMLRSLKSGVSGYVRLERRTLMGTLQFTINGVDSGGDLYAILLYRNNGGWSGIRLGEFSAPRYGQTGLVWKFDPRNIEGRTLEQFDLAAVIEIRNGLCELLLCGNLNGSVEADWTQIREAACRLFSPVRISGTPISPIDERRPASDAENEGIQTLPEYGKESPAYPGDHRAEETESSDLSRTAEEESPDSTEADDGCGIHQDESDASYKSNIPDGAIEPAAETAIESAKKQAEETPELAAGIQTQTSENDTKEHSEGDFCGCGEAISIFASGNADDPISERDELDVPADRSEAELDELDIPAQDAAFMVAAKSALSTASAIAQTPIEPDEFDTPAQETDKETLTAGEQLALDDPDAAWPDSIEPLRALFFSSEAVVPFETAGYVYIRAPLPSESGYTSCLIGLLCENGVPSVVCYAIPAAYTAEPPAGLEGYVWRGDHARGYWVICEKV